MRREARGGIYREDGWSRGCQRRGGFCPVKKRRFMRLTFWEYLLQIYLPHACLSFLFISLFYHSFSFRWRHGVLRTMQVYYENQNQNQNQIERV